MTRLQRETAIGSSAVLMWGALALLTTWTGDIPPFQLVAMSFAIAFALALGKWVICGEGPARYLRHPPAVWMLGIGGLFGYHFLYFMALRNAPPVEASLIAYLWPLLIVLFSALLPGGRLRWWHIAGAALGFGGCVSLIGGGGGFAWRGEYTVGYMAAIGCALVWSGYSVLSRRHAAVPTDTVAWFCAAASILGLLCHWGFEQTVWPAHAGEWLAVAGLGLGPVGVAFFAWDRGVKHGDLRFLGVFSYAAPMLSTLLLVLFGKAEARWGIALACTAIIGGAVLAARDLIFSGKTGAST